MIYGVLLKYILFIIALSLLVACERQEEPPVWASLDIYRKISKHFKPSRAEHNITYTCSGIPERSIIQCVTFEIDTGSVGYMKLTLAFEQPPESKYIQPNERMTNQPNTERYRDSIDSIKSILGTFASLDDTSAEIAGINLRHRISEAWRELYIYNTLSYGNSYRLCVTIDSDPYYLRKYAKEYGADNSGLLGTFAPQIVELKGRLLKISNEPNPLAMLPPDEEYALNKRRYRRETDYATSIFALRFMEAYQKWYYESLERLKE